MRVEFLILASLTLVLGRDLPSKIPRVIELERISQLRGRYIYNIPEPLKDGNKIEIEGKSSSQASKFYLNLVSTLYSDGNENLIHHHQRVDITLQETFISARIDEKWVDNIIVHAPTVKPGENFKVTYEITTDGTFTFYNNNTGKMFYPHQSPFKDIKYITINDATEMDVEKIHSIKFYF
ncbi:uncharacterized protein LOC143919305 [Arctopsyche grandis]|uniref:uncharacterized protein LOC143919305 n=1 Tax=Arctopsyche grandis TaxID=121162 RepID=UPI00406D6FC6